MFTLFFYHCKFKFFVIGSYDSIPEYTGIRQSLVSGTPPVYTQSDFARFPPKSYHHKNAVVNPAVIHGNYDKFITNYLDYRMALKIELFSSNYLLDISDK